MCSHDYGYSGQMKSARSRTSFRLLIVSWCVTLFLIYMARGKSAFNITRICYT